MKILSGTSHIEVLVISARKDNSIEIEVTGEELRIIRNQQRKNNNRKDIKIQIKRRSLII